MLIQANLLTLGKEPDIEMVPETQKFVAKFPVAENHNYNAGTKDSPDWKTASTSWYQMIAYGDVVNQIMEDQLGKGDSIKLIKGVHKKRKRETEDGQTKYYDEYKILEYEKRNWEKAKG